MKKTTSSEFKRGQAVTFRIPSDTSDYTLGQLQKLRETERRNFSSKLAQFVLNGIGSDVQPDKELVTLSLPHALSREQRDWLKHAHSEALLGSILYEILKDPMRATALFASLHDDVIKVTKPIIYESERELVLPETEMEFEDVAVVEEDVKLDKPQTFEPDEQFEELLGAFLAQMNK